MPLEIQDAVALKQVKPPTPLPPAQPLTFDAKDVDRVTALEKRYGAAYGAPNGKKMHTFSVEQGNAGSCTSLEGRQMVSAMRFFWDIVDKADDDSETLDLTMFNIYDSLAAWPCSGYPACFGSGELHDAYSAISNALDTFTVPVGNEDIGHAWTFRGNMLNNYSAAVDVQDAYWNNCMGFF